MNRTKLAIHGAAGRMGKRLIALGHADDRFELVAAVDHPEHPEIGQDAGVLAGIGEIGVPLSAQLVPQANVVIDFSIPEACTAVTQWCHDQGIALVAATTGLDDQQQQMLKKVSQKIAVLWAPNMSLAVNLTAQLSALAAGTLAQVGTKADVEIMERHHHFKEDAPSGTAIWLGQVIADRMGQTSHQHGREGLIGKRPSGEIGYHALRVGDNPGEHTIVFGMLGETIELTVRATNRDCYALGALQAADFLTGQTPGLYGMHDVLGVGCE